MWPIFHKFGSPPWLYSISGAILRWLLPITLLALITGAIWGLLFTPPENVQGNSYRIIYIHVPAAVVALAGYYVMALAGAVSLIWRMKMADVAMKAAAPVVALYEAFDNKEAAGKACAVLSLVGMVNIPIIYKSVDWWYSLHQGASIKFTGETSIHSSMLYPLLLMIAAFYALFTCALLLNIRAELVQREQRTQWVRKLIDKNVVN